MSKIINSNIISAFELHIDEALDILWEVNELSRPRNSVIYPFNDIEEFDVVVNLNHINSSQLISDYVFDEATA